MFRYSGRRALTLNLLNVNCITGFHKSIKLCSRNIPYNKNNNDETDRNYEDLVKNCFLHNNEHCIIIHPYIKWGPRKKRNITVHSQMAEAVGLINTIPGWKVCNEIIVPVENLDKKTLFGSGTITRLRQQTRQQLNTTSIFMNVSKLRNLQVTELEHIFGCTILDRYNVVMHILKAHAISTHAKLQFSLAEIYYLRSRLKYLDIGTSQNWETRSKMLDERELKIRTSIKKLRTQRELYRNKRKKLNYPIVAFVGYTNSGKTALIKSLTGEKSLTPKDQFFATLDVTMHAGLLPSNLKVLYVDTVGFISNIPTDLIECFIATIEDAVLADIIVHVQDISHENMSYQTKHVNYILNDMAKKVDNGDISKKIITVGNKWDIAHNSSKSEQDMILVSAKTMQGIDVLRQKIESEILKATDRNVLTIRVPSGGQEMRWLFKNVTVVEQFKDIGNSQFQLVKIIINNDKIKQFHKYFVSNN